MKKMFFYLGIAAVTMVAAFLIYTYFLSPYLSLEYVKLKAALLKDHVNDNYVLAVGAYILAFAVMITFGLPVTAPLGVLGGFLFNLIPGFIYAMITIMISTTCSFLMIRKTLSKVLHEQYKTQLESFNAQLHQYGFSYLISLHLASIVPYFLINTLAALAHVPITTFLWTTALGAIPSVFIYVFAGRQLYQIRSWGDMFSTHMVILLALLAVLALIPMVIRRMSKKTSS